MAREEITVGLPIFSNIVGLLSGNALQLIKPIATEKPIPSVIRGVSLDELLDNRGRLVTGGLPFPELKQREHINPAARAAGHSPDFSALIRARRIGFQVVVNRRFCARINHIPLGLQGPATRIPLDECPVNVLPVEAG